MTVKRGSADWLAERRMARLADVVEALSSPCMQIEMFTKAEMEGVPQAPWEGRQCRTLTDSFERFSLGAPPPWGLRAK